MSALVIYALVYAGIVVTYILVSRHHAWAGDAAGNPFNLLGLGEAEPEHPADSRARQLTEQELNGFVRVWQSVRMRFDRDPKQAVVYADLLVSDLVANKFEKRTRAGNCNLNQKYRTVHELIRSGQTITVNTVELRRAMCLYTALFDELVRTGRSHSR